MPTTQRNRFGLAFGLLLTMVFAIACGPVRAACVPHPPQAGSAAGCGKVISAACDCCGPLPAVAAERAAGREHAGCGCTLGVPAEPAPALEETARLFLFLEPVEASHLPPAFRLPNPTSDLLPTENARLPRSPDRSASPARAPPFGR